MGRSGRLLTRRAILAFPALARAQQAQPTVRLGGLNHMTLMVRDVQRSLEFYQRLFGMPVQAQQGNTILLRIGTGPQFMALSAAARTQKPLIHHFCFTAENFETRSVLDVLAAHGITPAESAGSRDAARKVRVRMRGAEFGGAPEGTPELYVSDPDGIIFQLQHPDYCGGAGMRGEICSSPEPPLAPGKLQLKDFNHFTLSVSDEARSRNFYQKLFGLSIQVRQGDTPLFRIGQGRQTIAMSRNNPTGATPGTPGIAHACLTLDGFQPGRVLKALSEVGVQPREDRAAPLASFIIMRMPARGGAPDGTPELYFTDPDGICLQLQDAAYCGGAGYLGDSCPG